MFSRIFVAWTWSKVRVSWQDCILNGHSRSVRSVVFSPDGTRVVSGSEDKHIKIWDAATGYDVSGLVGMRCD